MTPTPWSRSRRLLGVLAAACLASACSSVDLGPRYDPPPIRMPEPLPAEPVAQPQAVPPAAPVPQPLPPVTAPVSPSPDAGAPADTRAALVTFSARLDGASAIPPARSGATGQLDALYDSGSRLLRWKASWNGLSGGIIGVQFHGPADSGQVAAATVIWPAPFGHRYEGRATLTPAQATDLLSGRWYVSVDTANYPQGEIRGQVRVVD